ncbi:hypothetical protein C8R44DRAFT_808888 [Mycena epipterygia]|nr:hypothetical protein C8R44DRAFT_808888 [Mycena epipterygia]
MASSQTLPPELERYILELAAFIHPECMPVLVLVARRAKIWIEPLLYRVIRVDLRTHTVYRRFIPLVTILGLIELKSPSFFHEHVRRLCLLGQPQQSDDVMRLLSACSTTVNVQLFGGGPELLPLLGTMPLHRLSASLTILFPGPTGPDFSHSLFTKITHLDLAESSHTWELWSGLAHMPCLTHLSFFHEFVAVAVCYSALLHCKSLQVLAMLSGNPPSTLGLAYRPLTSDPRFVLVGIRTRELEWETGALGGEDHWARANDLVRKRRSGETKDYFIRLDVD